MTTEQGYEEFETPDAEEIKRRSRAHVQAMESSDDPEAWVYAGMWHLVLCTVGRRSGAEHKVALPLWQEPAGDRIVVASNAGATRHPAWYLNLSDRAANPDVLVKVHGKAFRSVPEILTGDERRRVWDALTADRSFYADYQAQCERQIPLVRLREGGAGEQQRA